MERRTNHGPVELRGDEEKRIGGVAVVYYDGTPRTEFTLWPGAVERIMPGAFDRAVKEDDVRALFNHDPNLVLGRNKSGTLDLRSDESGLNYEITPADTTVYRDVTQHLARGDVTGSSFAFRIDAGGEAWSEDEERGVKVREISAGSLYDVSVVTYPAYEASESGMRSEDSADARQSFEQFQRVELDAQRQRDLDKQAQIEIEVT